MKTICSALFLGQIMTKGRIQEEVSRDFRGLLGGKIPVKPAKTYVLYPIFKWLPERLYNRVSG